jgi:hypothetical protein
LDSGQDLAIVLTGGPGDASDADSLAELLRAHIRNVPVISVAGSYSLAQTACLLRTAKAVVSVNTGIMHLAALLGVPTIGLSDPLTLHAGDPTDRKLCLWFPPKVPYAYLKLGLNIRQLSSPASSIPLARQSSWRLLGGLMLASSHRMTGSIAVAKERPRFAEKNHHDESKIQPQALARFSSLHNILSLSGYEASHLAGDRRTWFLSS